MSHHASSNTDDDSSRSSDSDSDGSCVGKRSSSVKPRRCHSLRRNSGVNFIQPFPEPAARKAQARAAIDRGDFKTFQRLCWWRDRFEHCEEEIKYMMETKSPEFIVDFVKKARIPHDETLAALYKGGSRTTIDDVLGRIEFSQHDMVFAASRAELVCQSPERLAELIKKIATLEDQKGAVDWAISDLFRVKRTDCFGTMLATLEGGDSLNHLKDVAIQGIFVHGAFEDSEVWFKRFYDHPAVTSEVYAKAMGSTWYGCGRRGGFRWLLESASHDDLLAAQSEGYYKHIDNDFYNAIEQRLSSVKPGKVRFDATGSQVEFIQPTDSVIISKPGLADIIYSHRIEDAYNSTDMDEE